MKLEHAEDDVIFRALQDVETPSYDIAAAVRAMQATSPPRVRRPKQLALALVICLVLTLSVGAVYLTLSENWQRFFQHSTIPQAAVNSVQASQTVDGYTLTLEDVLVDGSDGMLLLRLQREDGQPIPETIAFETSGAPCIDVKLVSSDGTESVAIQAISTQRTEDGKALFLCYSFSQKTSFAGASMTLRLSPLFCQKLRHVLYTPPAFEPIPQLPAGLKLDQEEARPLWSALPANPLSEPNDTGIFFRGFVQGDRSSYWVFSGKESNWTIGSTNLLSLSRETFSFYSARMLEGDADYAWTMFVEKDKLSDADLLGLNLDLELVQREPLTQEGFSIPFTSENSLSHSISFADQPFLFQGRKIPLARMELTPLRLSLLTESVPEGANAEIDRIFREGATNLGYPTLAMRDGREVHVSTSVRTSLREDGKQQVYYRVDYEFQDAEGNRLFPNPADVTAIHFGETQITVTP